VLLYGPPGTGKTLCARAVANRTDSTFIRGKSAGPNAIESADATVIGSELVQKYIGEGARMVRELFEMARSKKACIIFFDEVDAIGGAIRRRCWWRQRVRSVPCSSSSTSSTVSTRVVTSRSSWLPTVPTLWTRSFRPGRLDRKVEFSLPDVEGRAHILRIHGKSMSVERDIRYDLIARLCPNATGAELKSVATEAGMFAIRARRKVATERDFLDAVEKVIRQGTKFSSTALYAQYN
jgi:26S proteasome regulatory subunit T1